MVDKRRYGSGSEGPFKYDSDKHSGSHRGEGRYVFQEPDTIATVEEEFHHYVLTSGETTVLDQHIINGQRTTLEAVASGEYARYTLSGASNTLSILDNPANFWGSSPSAASFNIYYDSGSDGFYLENNTGGTASIHLFERTFET